MSWRNDPITDKQKECIKQMLEYSYYPLPDINLEIATKGEASDYIDKWGELGFEDVSSPMFGY